jgi:NADPH2:quinone reductase
VNTRGSLFLTRPSLAHYLGTREELVARVTDVMALVATGAIKVRISAVYTLSDAAQAYRDLEGRKTTGKLVLAVHP